MLQFLEESNKQNEVVRYKIDKKVNTGGWTCARKVALLLQLSMGAGNMENAQIMETNTLNDEIVFLKKGNVKLQRLVMKIPEQCNRLGDQLALTLLHKVTETIFAPPGAEEGGRRVIE